MFLASLKKLLVFLFYPLKRRNSDVSDKRLSEVAGRLHQSCNHGDGAGRVRRRRVLKYIGMKAELLTA